MSAFTYCDHNLDEYTMRYAFFFFSFLGQGGTPIHRLDEQRAESQLLGNNCKSEEITSRRRVGPGSRCASIVCCG
jgi:hypothetical protein